MVHSYFEPEKLFLQLSEKKSGTLPFGAQKMYITTLWSKEKEDDCYFKTEKLIHSYLEHEKKDPSYLEVGKTGS